MIINTNSIENIIQTSYQSAMQTRTTMQYKFSTNIVQNIYNYKYTTFEQYTRRTLF